MYRQKNTYTILLALLFVCGSLSAQLNKANRYFSKEAYSQAARLYERVLEKDSTDRLAINNLVHCYRHERRYADARKLFKKALRFSTAESNNHFYYAYMHFLLGDFNLAEEKLQEYLVHVPNDGQAKQLLEWTQIVSKFEPRTDFIVVPLQGINSPFADFAPVVHNAGLVFTTERKTDSGREEFDIENKPFNNIYYAPFSNKRQTSFWSPEVFASQLTTRFHDGPACFGSDGTTIYFTKVERQFTGSAKVNTMKVYSAHRDKDKWSVPELLPFNSSEYSVGHPALSENDTLLIFSSNMPGGYGGMDLYYSKFENDAWSEPINMGPMVNSAGDEVFPHIHEKTVYFSSDGWPGYGGLDLFTIHLDSMHLAPENMRAPVNSAWDDLSLSFASIHRGYFSSNRPGGLGRDDLYALERAVTPETHRRLSGILEYDNQPAPFTTLFLKDEEGGVLQKTVTDDNGYFALDFVKAQVPYSLVLDVADKERLKKFSLFFLNDQNQKVQKIDMSDSGDFKFELLKPDDHDNLELLEVEDASLLSLDIHGQVYENEGGDFTDRIEIVVLNSEGKIISRTFTRKGGKFLFKQLFPDDQYVFRLMADNPGLKISILDEQGNVLHRLTRTGRDFIYNRFAEGDQILSLLNEKNLTIKISPDDRFAIPNIYYDLDDFQLNESARKQLDKLVTILQKNPEIGVKVRSHTDSRASAQYNLRLSEKRAAEVIRYLESNAVDGGRIEGQGLGEQHLVNHCKDDVHCTEEEHARNRRTEFSIYSRNTE